MTMRLPALLALALLGSAALWAQAPLAPEGDRPLERFRQEQLQQTVGLPEDQARAVVERWSRYDRELFEKTRQVQAIRRRFNDILLGPGSEDEKNAKVRPLLDQFLELRRQQADLKFRFEEDIRARLSPAQQVRLVLHVEEMQRRVVEALRQGFGERPGLRPGPGGRRGLR
jgi:Spy/CpxP family protein refolding chaperone